MNLTNNEWVGRALECLRKGLLPLVVESLQREYGGGWQKEVEQSLGLQLSGTGDLKLDVQALVNLLLDRRYSELSSSLTTRTRAFVFELRDVRNRHAHQQIFESREVDRALDTTELLLRALGSPEAETLAAMLAQRATPTRDEVQMAADRRSSAIRTESSLPMEPSKVFEVREPIGRKKLKSGIVRLSRDFIKSTIEDVWDKQRRWVTRDQLAEQLNGQEWAARKLDAEGISDSEERRKRVGNWVDWFSANYTSGLHDLKDDFEQAEVDGKWAYRPRQKPQNGN